MTNTTTTEEPTTEELVAAIEVLHRYNTTASPQYLDDAFERWMENERAEAERHADRTPRTDRASYVAAWIAYAMIRTIGDAQERDEWEQEDDRQ